jgi:hypothetical protein
MPTIREIANIFESKMECAAPASQSLTDAHNTKRGGLRQTGCKMFCLSSGECDTTIYSICLADPDSRNMIAVDSHLPDLLEIDFTHLFPGSYESKSKSEEKTDSLSEWYDNKIDIDQEGNFFGKDNCDENHYVHSLCEDVLTGLAIDETNVKSLLQEMRDRHARELGALLQQHAQALAFLGSHQLLQQPRRRSKRVGVSFRRSRHARYSRRRARTCLSLRHGLHHASHRPHVDSGRVEWVVLCDAEVHSDMDTDSEAASPMCTEIFDLFA